MHLGRWTTFLPVCTTLILAARTGRNPVRAQQATVTGTVVSQAERPVELASVELLLAGPDTAAPAAAETATDSMGAFRLSASPGDYEIRISFLSFKPYTRAVIQLVQSLAAAGILRTTPINLSTSEDRELEIALEEGFTDDLKLSASADLFRAHTRGSYAGTVYRTDTNRLTSRVQLQWAVMGA